MCFAMPVNMPSTDRVSVLFYVRLYVRRDRVHDLVRCGVSVSGQIRVRDNARYRCCFHVSVSGSDRDCCGVRAEFDHVCDKKMFPLLFP